MRKGLIKVIAGAAFFLSGILFEAFSFRYYGIAAYVAAYLIVGYDVLFNAVKNIMQRKMLDENFLMTLATLGAFAIHEFPEAAAVMLLYQTGELFQKYAVGKSRKSIAALMDIRPDYANVIESGGITKKSPEDVRVGDLIIVGAGERIPLDGTVVEGFASIDASKLTGESIPREVEKGSSVVSGSININGVLTIEVQKEYSESTVSKILDLVENASNNKSKSEAFITKFARVYTPLVVIVAIMLATLPSLLFGGLTTWLYRALTFLVVSCPCALVISVPMSFFSGLGGASRSGILIKGSNYLEALAKTDTIVFDKTGTLTKGVFKVQKINPRDCSEEDLLECTALAECYSSHPISLSLRKAYGKEIDKSRVSGVTELAGFGIRARVDGKEITVGNARLMEKMNVPVPRETDIGTVVHVVRGENYAGSILIADEIKEDSPFAIKELKRQGIRRIVMLTGDLDAVGKSVADELGVDKVFTELLPGDKVLRLEELMSEGRSRGRTAFVGDGINDAPVLARADTGIAMGGLGSDAAIEAADVVIMTDEPSKVAASKRIAVRTIRIVKQNITFAIFVKVVILALSAAGLANMWMAIFADVGVSVLAILNAFRALKADGGAKKFDRKFAD